MGLRKDLLAKPEIKPREVRPPTRSAAAGGVGLIFVHVLAFGLVMSVPLHFVPRVESILADLDVALPRMTAWAIQFSHWVAGLWWLWLLVLVGECIVTFVVNFLPFSIRWIAPAWTILILLAGLAVSVILMTVVTSPLVSLTQNL